MVHTPRLVAYPVLLPSLASPASCTFLPVSPLDGLAALLTAAPSTMLLLTAALSLQAAALSPLCILTVLSLR